MNCYGIIKAGEAYYQVTDLVEDNVQMTCEKNDFQSMLNGIEYELRVK